MEKTINKSDYQKVKMNISILGYRSTRSFYIEEADDFFTVFSNDSDALKEYMFVALIDEMEDCNAVKAQKLYYKVFYDEEYIKWTNAYGEGIVLAQIDGVLKSVDVDGNKVDPHGSDIYFQIGDNRRPYLFKKTNNNKAKFDEYIKKYKVNTETYPYDVIDR